MQQLPLIACWAHGEVLGEYPALRFAHTIQLPPQDDIEKVIRVFRGHLQVEPTGDPAKLMLAAALMDLFCVHMRTGNLTAATEAIDEAGELLARVRDWAGDALPLDPEAVARMAAVEYNVGAYCVLIESDEGAVGCVQGIQEKLEYLDGLDGGQAQASTDFVRGALRLLERAVGT